MIVAIVLMPTLGRRVSLSTATGSFTVRRCYDLSVTLAGEVQAFAALALADFCARTTDRFR